MTDHRRTGGMTRNELTALCRRAMACPGFPKAPPLHTVASGRDSSGMQWFRPLESDGRYNDLLPDLLDPAALGVLLVLVGKAWRLPDVTAVNTANGWIVVSYWGDFDDCCGQHSSYVEALVAALEAAEDAR